MALMASLARSSGHVGTRTDTNSDTKTDIIYISLVSVGQKGYTRTRADTKNGVRSCSIVIQQGFRSAEGLAQWPPEVMRLANQVKAAEIWPEAVLWSSLDVVLSVSKKGRMGWYLGGGSCPALTYVSSPADGLVMVISHR